MMRQVALWFGIFMVFFSAERGFALSEEKRDNRINDFTTEILESFGTDRESVVKALGTPIKGLLAIRSGWFIKGYRYDIFGAL